MVFETVSVIIAVYNAENYLEACIESLCKQSYSALEIILVDDGSNDSSVSICDKWVKKDLRIKLVRQKNAGVSFARNRGIAIATGTYIAFLDSDDWIEPNFIEELVKNHQQDQIAVVGYWADFVGKRQHKLKKIYRESEICYLEQREVVTLFQAGLFSPIWNKLYDRKLITDNNIRFCEKMSLGEDIVFNLHYLNCMSGHICVINKPLYHYMRWGGESLDHRYNENYPELQKKIYSEFFKFLDRFPDNNDEKNILMGLYFNALVTSIDNLYLYRKNLENSFYRKSMKERKKDPELKRLLKEMKGRTKWIYSIRLLLLSHGFYVFDYYIRKIIKLILKLNSNIVILFLLYISAYRILLHQIL